ncbi:MAG: hypothetical protein ACF8XB_18335 [Planctomycetota bacterium JB042]
MSTNEKKASEGKPGEGSNDPNELLRIVREKDPKKKTEDLDLDLDEFEGDRRYGREDIADK